VDGRVELQATGDEEELRAFSIRSLKANFTRSFANNREQVEPTGRCRGFEIAMTNPAVAVHGLTKIFPVPFHPPGGSRGKDLSLRIEPGEV